VRAATLYYVDGYSQAEVAEEIGVSRSNVSRVLAAAREQGIVDIRINDPYSRVTDLERRIVDRYSLADCCVVPTGDLGDVLSRIGQVGADWLMENLPGNGGVALSWGSSVQAIVEAVPSEHTHDTLEILPLVGGLSIVDTARDGNVLVRLLASKLGASHRPLHAPAIVGARSTRDAILREQSINSVLRAASKARLAIVGIGSVGHDTSSALLDAMNLTPDEMRDFRAQGAVGDCCTRYYDAQGNPVVSAADDRVVGVDLKTLRSIPTVVGIAAGREKTAGLRGALAGKLLDVLVIDSVLAQDLLVE